MNLLKIISSKLFGIGVYLRNLFYDHGLFKSRKLPSPVISVGNLTVGGSGKTPLVAYLAIRLKESDYVPIVLSHGYKGKVGRSALIVSDGTRIHEKPEVCGDEAYLLARKLEGVSIAAGKNRYQAGRFFTGLKGRVVYLLDDGFQHLKLHRTIDLLLIDGSRDINQEVLLPAGRLREPLAAMGRADAIIITREHLADSLDELVGAIRRFHPTAPIFPFSHEIEAVYDLVSKELFSPTDFRGQKVVALAALGSPGQFLEDLKREGISVEESHLYQDHHRYTQDDLNKVLARCRELKAVGIMTTEKDAVRLQRLRLEAAPVFVVSIKAKTRDPATFMNWLAARLESG